jgi:phage terminase Nu1 subunit (DNA packaging protein)
MGNEVAHDRILWWAEQKKRQVEDLREVGAYEHNETRAREDEQELRQMRDRLRQVTEPEPLDGADEFRTVRH